MGKTKSFKDEFSFEERFKESSDIIGRYPDRVPVIAEKYYKCNLRELEKKKYLVPRDMTIGQFIHILNNRLHIDPGQALFVFVRNTLPQTAAMMESVYDSYKDEDGFLYLCYSSEKTFGMGRVKLKIKRLESSNGRQTTYAKRRQGILKKANELAILCDIDLLLLMFSPTGKPSLCVGERGIEQVIAKFAQLTPQERVKRQLEGLEALKKTFKKLDHDINIQDFMGDGLQTVEGLTEQIMQIRTELKETDQRLSYWSDPAVIESFEHLEQMEESLRKSLDAINAHKENLEKQQQNLHETTAQIQNEMQIPYRVNIEQHYQPIRWIPTTEGPHISITNDPNLIPQSDMECLGSSSFATSSSYLDLCKRVQSDTIRDDTTFLSELSRLSPTRLFVNEQYSFPSYGNTIMSNSKNYHPAADTNLQSAIHLEPQATFGTSHLVFDTNNPSWASTSGPFGESVNNSWASACGPFADTMHSGWGSTPGPCAAPTANGSWAYPFALFDEHYQQPH